MGTSSRTVQGTNMRVLCFLLLLGLSAAEIGHRQRFAYPRMPDFHGFNFPSFNIRDHHAPSFEMPRFSSYESKESEKEVEEEIPMRIVKEEKPEWEVMKDEEVEMDDGSKNREFEAQASYAMEFESPDDKENGNSMKHGTMKKTSSFSFSSHSTKNEDNEQKQHKPVLHPAPAHDLHVARPSDHVVHSAEDSGTHYPGAYRPVHIRN